MLFPVLSAFPVCFSRLTRSFAAAATFTTAIVTAASPAPAAAAPDTSSGWVKHPANPVVGDKKTGTCFDVSMLREDGLFKMWFSWRPKHSLAYTESKDGVKWSAPRIVLPPPKRTAWESNINRPGILKKDGVYHLWFTGQHKGRSAIGYATSPDGLNFTRHSEKPVLVAEQAWEKTTVMCPHVEWDAPSKLFRMWYSGGEQYEPNAIGYATSPDGVVWEKHPKNPVFAADKNNRWERHKVTAAQLLRHDGWWYMFYIGFEHDNLARIGMARSRDGVTNWERHAGNPIVSPGPKGTWDSLAVYKPFVIYTPEDKLWRLWYNGRPGALELIGLVTKHGEDLGFVPAPPTKPPAGNAVGGEKPAK
ncbi:MAG: family 43 glycosylhydrolase [Puniceicoccales bacterium]|nr:family 43 glycosylhydrolase [Puniceicoccales bacterium]